MSLIIAKSVDFGVIKGSLSTVGYVLKNADGSVKQARTTVGVTEMVAGKGIYTAVVTFDVGFSGFILWDSGDAGAYYAIEEFDGRTYQGSGGGVALHMPVKKPKDEIWSLEDKKKILKNLKLLMEGVTTVSGKSDDISSSLINNFKTLKEVDLKNILDRKIDFSSLDTAIKELQESVCAMKSDKIDFSCVEKKLEEIKILVESQKELLDPIIDGVSALIESENAKSVQGDD